jgi:cytochrome c551/c552
MTTRKEILTAALAHREAEVFQHQINIDNYTLAIAEIDANYADDAAIADFRVRLADLLASSIVEQRKEIIMRDVIARQVEG